MEEGELCCLDSDSQAAHLLLMPDDGGQGVSRMGLDFSFVFFFSISSFISSPHTSATTFNVSL